MPVEDILKELLEHVARQFDAARAELGRTIEVERTAAAALAREAAEADRAQAVAQAEAAAEERGRTAGRAEGKQEGHDAGFASGREQGLQEGRDEGRKEGREEGREEGRQEGRQEGDETAREATATSQRLAEAVRTIDSARSLSEILDTLVTSAGREAARAALLLVRGPQLRAWRFVGFSNVADHLELPLAEGGVLAEAVRSASTASADSGAAESLPSFAQLPSGRHVLAVPVQLSGQVIAVLYADPGAAGSDAKPAWPATVEVLTRYAARCIEATTAFRAARVLTEPHDRSSTDEAPSSSPREPADRVDDAQAAQRYARLLVSEIKLYHEADVVAGRRERDLATRLGGEIARARVLYEQRVPAHVRRSGDHFHAELVRTLADGDASLLNVKT